QLVRFKDRIVDPLKYWKYSDNDKKVRAYWDVLTKYKDQMFERTASPKSPWVVIGSDNKMEARIKSMLYVVSTLNQTTGGKFKPLQKDKPDDSFSITIHGVAFNDLTRRQFTLLRAMSRAFYE